MIPSSEQMARNIVATCEGLAREIAERVYHDSRMIGGGVVARGIIESHARAVLIDWLLSDFVPVPPTSTSTPTPKESKP
jgi:hypothetical protein